MKKNSRKVSQNNKKTATYKKNKVYVVSVIIVVTLIVLIIAGLALTGNLENFLHFINDYLSEDTKPNMGGNGLSAAEGELAVHFVDVGQGDCIIIQFPDQKTMIIDGGDRESKIAEKVRGYLKNLQIDTLDYVLLTHTDADHCGSLDDALKEVDNVEKVFLPKIKTRSEDTNTRLGITEDVVTISTQVYNEFVEEVLNSTYNEEGVTKSTKYEFLIDEIVIEGGSYRLTMYCASEAYYNSFSSTNSKAINDVSPICVLEYHNKKIIFTGDANSSASSTTSAEKRFIQALNSKSISSYKSDVLKVAHHGGKDSSGMDFLQLISPKYAVVSVGLKGGNKSSGEYEGFVNSAYYQSGYTFITQGNGAYDHPHRDVVGVPKNGEGRLAQSGVSELYRTDTHGDIVLIISADKDMEFFTQNTASVNDTTIVFVEVTMQIMDTEVYFHIYYEDRLRVF